MCGAVETTFGGLLRFLFVQRDPRPRLARALREKSLATSRARFVQEFILMPIRVGRCALPLAIVRLH